MSPALFVRLLGPILLAAALSTACSDPPAQNPPPSDECAAGELGCECKDDGTCDEGLTCTNGLCVPNEDDPNPDPNPGPNPDPNPNPNPGPNPDPNPDPMPFEGLGLEIGPDTARACEVVLRDEAAAISEVTFTGGATGRFLRRGERLALAFVAADDTPFTQDSVGFALDGEAADVEGVEIVVSQCFDVQGQPLGDTLINIVDGR